MEEAEPYKKVLQMSQAPEVPKPNYLKPRSTTVDGPEPASEYSPFKTYYVQKAAGIFFSYTQHLIDDHFSGTEILPNLWIATHASVSNLQALQDRNITHVICAILGVSPRFPKQMRYTCVPIRDVETEDVYRYFDQVADLIHEDLKQERAVLVHCRFGVSRSVTLVCAYLIKYKGMTYTEAIKFVQSKRSCACPIRSFRDQLRSYEANQK